MRKPAAWARALRWGSRLPKRLLAHAVPMRWAAKIAFRLGRRLTPKCPDDVICMPYTAHGPLDKDWVDWDSIKTVCLKCGKETPWIKVIV